MGHCLDCGADLDELVVSETRIASGIVYECPSCGAIAGVADATDI
jgi:DNA-directed RNA polymerase subunit RPC12/RpoP